MLMSFGCRLMRESYFSWWNSLLLSFSEHFHCVSLISPKQVRNLVYSRRRLVSNRRFTADRWFSRLCGGWQVFWWGCDAFIARNGFVLPCCTGVGLANFWISGLFDVVCLGLDLAGVGCMTLFLVWLRFNVCVRAGLLWRLFAWETTLVVFFLASKSWLSTRRPVSLSYLTPPIVMCSDFVISISPCNY